MRTLCTILFRNEEELSKAFDIISTDLDPVKCTNCSKLVLKVFCKPHEINKFIGEIEFISFEAKEIVNCEDNFITHQLKDSNGNIIYESHNDGYYEENVYSEYSNKLLKTTSHYTNGMVETERFFDNIS